MSAVSQPLLIELFTEELPPKALKKLGEAFAAGIEASLRADGLLTEGATTVSFATPRRLGARVSTVLSEAPAKAIKEKLMPIAVARDATGNATVALRKKLAALGREALADGFPNATLGPDKLVIESDGKAEYVYLVGLAPGNSLAAGVQNAIAATLAKLPTPKSMTYQLADGETDINFVRPAHGLVALHGNDVIPAAALGLEASRITHGHRFQGANNIEIDSAARYEELLREYGKVEPIFRDRQEMILNQLLAKAQQLSATLGDVSTYADLLDEVTSLVEWPTVYVCQFEPEFLTVPQECLILTMKTNQKYFPLFDAAGKLKNQFLIVSNMELANPSRVISGNERVVRPRLADARFFFETDKKIKLADRVSSLGKIVYHNKLGTQGERIARVTKLAGEIATLIGADRAKAERAATLAKADLVTLMVSEFPELQGTMGRYYALNDGEAPDVAAACAEHYQPRFAGDALPSSGVPTAVALADKLETLVGMFGIGNMPTGDKDPFALRRHALGVIRILIEQKLPLQVRALLDKVGSILGFENLGDQSPIRELRAFLYERLAGLQRTQGYTALEVDAVLSLEPQNLAQVPSLLSAVRAFVQLPEATALISANKRIGNILKKSPEASDGQVDTNLLHEPAEIALRAAMLQLGPQASAQFEAGQYIASLQTLAALRVPIDAFFEGVMVNVDNPDLKASRISLLASVHKAMNRIALLERLAT